MSSGTGVPGSASIPFYANPDTSQHASQRTRTFEFVEAGHHSGPGSVSGSHPSVFSSSSSTSIPVLPGAGVPIFRPTSSSSSTFAGGGIPSSTISSTGMTTTTTTTTTTIPLSEHDSSPLLSHSESLHEMNTGVGSVVGGGSGVASGSNSSGGGLFGWVYVDDDDPANDPPLLDELGIHVEHVRAKTLAVLNPFARRDASVIGDSDMAGPLCFLALLGVVLMLKQRFYLGNLFGVSAVGSIFLYLLLSLMSETGARFGQVTSTLGYCLLPLVILSLCTMLLPLGDISSHVLLWMCVSWCTWSAATMFVNILHMQDSRWLVAYPVFLFYTCFGFIALF